MLPQASAAAASPAKLHKPAAVADVTGAKDAAAAVAAKGPSPAPAAAAPSSSDKPPAAPVPKVAAGAKPAAAASKPKTKAAPAAKPAAGPAAVGKSVKVYWPTDDAWYTGDIQGKLPAVPASKQPWVGGSSSRGRI